MRSTSIGLVLILEFGPAPNEKVDELFSEIQMGVKKIILLPSNTEIEALGVDNGRLLIAVSSVEHAKHLLKLLCFDGTSIQNLQTD